MGYSTDSKGIRSYSPDDDDTTIYTSYWLSLEEILRLTKEKWPNATPDQITIETEHIQTDCLGYGNYDSSDWSTFIRITLNPPAN